MFYAQSTAKAHNNYEGKTKINALLSQVKQSFSFQLIKTVREYLRVKKIESADYSINQALKQKHGFIFGF